MKCPRCGLIVTDQVPQCQGCGFSLRDLDRLLRSVPNRSGFVNDFAGVLSPEEKATLEAYLARFHQSTGGEIVLVTVASTRPVKPSEYVFWLFNRWEVGGAHHAGVMLLLALKERRIESEVGYALEGILSDVESAEVLEQHVVPLLKEGRMGEALRVGVEQIAGILEKAVQLPEAPSGGAPRSEEARS